jgi:hypothetical protein
VNPALPIDEETDGQQITIADVADGEPWNYSMVFREREYAVGRLRRSGVAVFIDQVRFDVVDLAAEADVVAGI